MGEHHYLLRVGDAKAIAWIPTDRSFGLVVRGDRILPEIEVGDRDSCWAQAIRWTLIG